MIWMIYTAWALLVATGLLWRLIAGPRCAHAWQLVDKSELPSRLEVMCKHWKPNTMTHEELNEMSVVKATLVLRCDRCGAAKIIHMTNK